MAEYKNPYITYEVTCSFTIQKKNNDEKNISRILIDNFPIRVYSDSEDKVEGKVINFWSSLGMKAGSYQINEDIKTIENNDTAAWVKEDL